jgi:glycosyltransferase involved in cell wall biosynthesis
MEAHPHTLSIIVVTYNEAHHVARLQQSIERLRRPPGMEIESILVDGGSQDGTAAAARDAGYTHVLEFPGANIPVCRNHGAAAAQGDWIAYVDGDCELTEDWLEQAMPLLARPEPTLLGWPARPPDPMNRLQAAWNFHWLNKNPRLEELAGRQVVREQGFRLATTRNMMLQRAVFDAINGFNEELPTGEDTDFAFRAYMHGVQVLGVPALRVFHHGEPATLGDFYKQQVWHANRRSYQHIQQLSGGKVGGNAPRFAMAFLIGLLSLITGIAVALIAAQPAWLLLALPLVAVVTLPAAWISFNGRSLRHFPMLCLLYAAYGVARVWDLVGLSRAKPSWKSKAA